MYEIENIKNTILCGNALEILKEIPDNSINMVFTSPPYFGLRNYNTNLQVWDGKPDCNHDWIYRKNIEGGFCSKCDAWMGELGQEPDYHLFIEHLIIIFREIKRVLTFDGTCWVNIGDCYAKKNNGVPKKSLYGIPERFKIGMMDDGWICRNNLVWYKRNAMPESVKDRFVIDYEPIYLFAKNSKYYFNQQKEPCVNGDPTSPRGSRGASPNSGRRNKQDALGKTTYAGFNGGYVPKTERLVRSVWDIPVQPFRGAHFATFPPRLLKIPIMSGCPENGIILDPFFGSGTVGLVAKSLNRKYLGIELNQEYIKIAEDRLKTE